MKRNNPFSYLITKTQNEQISNLRIASCREESFLKLWKEAEKTDQFAPLTGIPFILTGIELCSFLWRSLPASGHAEPELLFCETVQLSRQSVLLGSGLQMHEYPEQKNKTRHWVLFCFVFSPEEMLLACFSHTGGFGILKAAETNSCSSVNLFYQGRDVILQAGLITTKTEAPLKSDVTT